MVTISGLTNYSSIDAFRNKFAPNNIVMLTQRKNNNMVSPIFLSLSFGSFAHPFPVFLIGLLLAFGQGLGQLPGVDGLCCAPVSPVSPRHRKIPDSRHPPNLPAGT